MARAEAFGAREIQRGKRHGWERLLERLTAGPPRAYRLRSVAPIRYVEEWIHHEDVRRANGQAQRVTAEATDDVLWLSALELLRLSELLPGREAVEVVRPDGVRHQLGPSVRVSITGRPGEILLYLAGRTEFADVKVDGADADIRRLHGSLHV
jgi:uncharacterized protein (TIGR03085 family)